MQRIPPVIGKRCLAAFQADQMIPEVEHERLLNRDQPTGAKQALAHQEKVNIQLSRLNIIAQKLRQFAWIDCFAIRLAA